MVDHLGRVSRLAQAQVPGRTLRADPHRADRRQADHRWAGRLRVHPAEPLLRGHLHPGLRPATTTRARRPGAPARRLPTWPLPPPAKRIRVAWQGRDSTDYIFNFWDCVGLDPALVRDLRLIRLLPTGPAHA